MFEIPNDIKLLDPGDKQNPLLESYLRNGDKLPSDWNTYDAEKRSEYLVENGAYLKSGSEPYLAKHVLRSYQGWHHEALEKRPGLRFDDGQFWRYTDEGFWIAVPDYDVKARIMKIDLAPLTLKKLADGRYKIGSLSLSERKIKGILNLVRNELQSLYGHTFANPRSGIAFENGFWDAEERKFIPNSHQHAARWSAGCTYDPTSLKRLSGSLLDQYIGSIFPQDDEARNAKLAAIFGFIGAVACGIAWQFKKAFICHGPQGSGKSQLLEMAMSMLPEHAVCSVPPQSFDEKHSGFDLFGKALNAVSELSREPIKSGKNLKGAIHGEHIRDRALYGQHTRARVLCGHMWCTNVLPKIEGLGVAFLKRFILIPFECTFRDTSAEVQNIGKRIAEEERPLLYAYALKALEEMQTRGCYPEIPGHKEQLLNWQRTGDTASSWMKRTCNQLDLRSCPDTWGDVSDLYQNYRNWCTNTGCIRLDQSEWEQRLANADVEILQVRSQTRANLQQRPTGAVRDNVEEWLDRHHEAGRKDKRISKAAAWSNFQSMFPDSNFTKIRLTKRLKELRTKEARDSSGRYWILPSNRYSHR